ncbi:hypothetical protein [Microvirga vignae]|uniref:hypothetical protein n=1 Tax=Microvirga vignae TaxID=1225564 RepID=UPI00123768FE|nr:hypothetical protein [Microvirga vignae]
MTPEQAKAVLDPVLLALRTSVNSYQLYQLSLLNEAVSVLARRLTSDQASAVLDLLVRDLEVNNNPYQLSALSEAVGLIPSQLKPKQMTVVLNSLPRALQVRTAFDQLSQLGRAIKALAPRLTQEQINQILSISRVGLANSGSEFAAEIWASMITEMLKLKSEVVPTADVVQMLKYPTAGEKPTEILLASLGEQFVITPLKSLQEVMRKLIKPSLKLGPSLPASQSTQVRLTDRDNV